MKDKYYFFWNGFCSQWHPSKFRIGKAVYNCAEQWMMANKALLFDDLENWQLIMETDSPMTQKRIGRLVQNFDVTKWNEVARDIVYEGNLAKFQQNPELLQMLVDTGDKIIVEASPYDTIWGIGMSELDEDRFDESKWRGTNWLGECIMRVRTELVGH